MILESSPRCLIFFLTLLSIAQGSIFYSPLTKSEPSNEATVSTDYHSKRKLNSDTSSGEDDIDFNKRSGSSVGSAIEPEVSDGQSLARGWWPWQNGVAPVRRSYFVPRLGKRAMENYDDNFLYFPCKDYDEMLNSEEGVPQAEIISLKNILENGSGDSENVDNSVDDVTYSDENRNPIGDRSYDNEDICALPFDRETRSSYSFVPRLGKKSYSFAPRLGKKAYSFAPRLGKKAYSFAPRLGKRLYSFAPRLGKKAYSFAPRLGKRTYSFAPRLGKKAYSFAPRLG